MVANSALSPSGGAGATIGIVTEKDWVAVVADATCDECGLLAAAVPRELLSTAVRDEAEQWADILSIQPPALLIGRPLAGWSVLEYAAHVRDVLKNFANRVERTLREHEPVFGWWDHERAAIEDAYNDQDPQVVAGALRDNAEHLAALADGVREPGWNRGATRRLGEHFTTEGLLRFALHEMRHHRVDAQHRIDGAASGT